MNKIANGNSLRDIIDSVKQFEDIPKVTTQTEMMEQLARKYGQLIVTMSLKECDTEIARYAFNNPKVLAIVADDSDFLIYPGHWRYFSLRNIDYDNFETYEYSRTALRSFLNLTDKELAILSALNGNDIIKYDKVRDNFHVKMDSFKHKFADFRFPNLADCARKLSILEQRAMYQNIHRFIGYGEITLVEESFEMYNPVRNY
jgi:hypothetical protein